MTWKRRARWLVLVGVVGVIFGRWCLRATAMGDSPPSRLTLVPRDREPEGGRETPRVAALGVLEQAVREQPQDRARRFDPALPKPRDLEIRVAAPESARAVTVALPSGEIISPRYDADRGVWSLHFFVEAGANGGTCVIALSIVSAQGSAEGLRLPCTTSPDAPVVGISLQRVGARGEDVEITARALLVAEGRTTSGTAASVVEHARHVEVVMPDRRLVILGLVGDGTFRGYWHPSRMPKGPLEIRVVSVDRALDERASEVSLALPPVVTADATPVVAARQR